MHRTDRIDTQHRSRTAIVALLPLAVLWASNRRTKPRDEGHAEYAVRGPALQPCTLFLCRLHWGYHHRQQQQPHYYHCTTALPLTAHVRRYFALDAAGSIVRPRGDRRVGEREHTVWVGSPSAEQCWRKTEIKPRNEMRESERERQRERERRQG